MPVRSKDRVFDNKRVENDNGQEEETGSAPKTEAVDRAGPSRPEGALEGQDAKQVAAAYLKARGLIQ